MNEAFVLIDSHFSTSFFAGDFDKTQSYERSTLKAMGTISVIDGSREFQQAISDPKKNIVIQFFAPWCGACKMMGPHYAKMAGELPAETFVCYRIDADANKDLGKSHNLETLPTFVVYKGGQIIYRQSGTVHEKLRKALMDLAK